MTSYTGELSSTPSDVRQIADLAVAQAAPQPLGDAPMVYVLPDGHHTHVVDPQEWAPKPARKRGKVHFTDSGSFASYVAAHKGDGTTLWADAKAGRLVAVLDDHQPEDTEAGGTGTPGWGEHRATLALEFTEDWLLWRGQDGKRMLQSAFAEHIEDAAPTIRKPSAADMLEIAQSFKATTKVRFESGKRVANGETELSYVEDTNATAGRKGTLEVPEVIVLGIAPWTSCTQGYELRARLRYRIQDGALVLFYKLDRPDDTLRNAFADVLACVESETDITAYHGTPR